MTPCVSESQGEKAKSSLGSIGMEEAVSSATGLSVGGFSGCVAGDGRSVALALLFRLGASVIDARLATLARGLWAPCFQEVGLPGSASGVTT